MSSVTFHFCPDFLKKKASSSSRRVIRPAVRTFRCGAYQNLVTVSLSVSPDVMLAYCMLKIYVPGGVRAEGRPYHENDGSFVLGAIPEDEASGGRTVGHRNPKYVAPHKGHQFGGPGLNELSFR